MRKPKKTLRKFEGFAIQELDENGQQVKIYSNVYELQEKLGCRYQASTLIRYIRLGYKIKGRTFKIYGLKGDYEQTSNKI